MDIITASGHLAELLETEDDQYAPALRVAHLNEATRLLARRYEIGLNERLVDYTWYAEDGKVAVAALNNSELEAEIVVDMPWYNPSVANKPIVLCNITELLNEFGDTEGEPQGIAQFSGEIWIRPIPTENAVIRFKILGVPFGISSGSNQWFLKVPWAVIFRAAEIGCIVVGQKDRLSEFKMLRTEQIDSYNISDSSRNDTPAESEEPG